MAPDAAAREGDIAMSSILDSVRALAPAIREHAASIEQERCLPEALVSGLIDAGVFRMLVPRSLGGDAYYLMAEMDFADEAALKTAMKSQEMAAAGANLDSFAKGMYSLMFGEELADERG